jgi:opacity protein-like surface antigen
MNMKTSIAAFVASAMLALCAAQPAAAANPYWQFDGKWLCTSSNGSTVGYDFTEVNSSYWLTQATIFNNGEAHQWVQNYIQRNPNSGNWIALNFQAAGITFQGRSSGFDQTGTLTFTGVEQGLDGNDYQAREAYSFQKNDGKMAHDWQIQEPDGTWKTTSSTTCSRTK